MRTAFTDIRLFDGEQVHPTTTVVVENGFVASVGDPEPAGIDHAVDGTGRTLLPGLIDAHAHTLPEDLTTALRFGVTTVLEMGGPSSAEDRAAWAARPDSADVRSAGLPVTAPHGHPTQLFAHLSGPDVPDVSAWPQTSTPEEARRLVDRLVDSGSDYVKFILEEGTVMGDPGLPLLRHDAYAAGVRAAHERGVLTMTHAQTAATWTQAAQAGADALVHLFIDRPHDDRLVDTIAASGAFVTPCLVLARSFMGLAATDLAADPRVVEKLDPLWVDALGRSLSTWNVPFDDALASVAALDAAGIDVLVGTDASIAFPGSGGPAHGASVHHELALLVEAGLSPARALRAATSVPARRFGLDDRGRVAPGLRADLLLVDGDPTTTIGDSLSIAGVWRSGRQLAGEKETVGR
ncbi:amidohydrolase family protein [Actinomycetospora sp. CA-084318]|uniref:amidohydrolase family protein n=1 Tax=Actinomycetospora sp. CA-084318 TaxID=3239892 RepID=UPI003D96153E